MKRPQPDLNEGIKNTFVAKTGANRKFKRLWGTAVVNGVEVINARRHYHKESARPENYKKLFKFLKVYDDVKDYEGEGVKSAWFELNKNNGPEDLGTTSNYVADNLNRMWWDSNDGAMPDNLTLTTTVVISEKFDNSTTINGIDWGASKEVLIQHVVDNYESMWDAKKIVQEGIGVINKGFVLDTTHNVSVADEDDLSPDDPWLATLSRYALRSSGIPCTIKDLEVGIGKDNGRVYNTLVVTLEIPYYEFENSDPIVQRILNDLSTANFPSPHGRYSLGINGGFITNNEQITQTAAKQGTYYETEDDVDRTVVTRQYLQWGDSTVQSSIYDNFWIRDGDNWYLKADVIDNPKSYGTTHVKLNAYIFSLLDTGYKKEKVPIWKKIVAVVIFVIAVIMAFIDYSQSSSSSLMAAAYAILAGALVVSLFTAVLSAIGSDEWAMAFAWVSKEIEPLVTVASIIMVVNFLSTAADTIAEQGVSGLFDMVASETIGVSFTEMSAGSISSNKVITVINKAVTAYTNVQLSKIKNISNKNKDLKAEYEKLAEETAMESDIMKGYMNIYARPATADWSIYASAFDLPYERGGGALAMGNIQRTTKQATRKSDYDEPMFEGIMLV